jgi:hypothetical protein
VQLPNISFTDQICCIKGDARLAKEMQAGLKTNEEVRPLIGGIANITHLS